MELNQFFQLSLVKNAISAILATIVTVLVSLLLKLLIDVIFAHVKGNVSSKKVVAKSRTLSSFLKNSVDILLVIGLLFTVLSIWGVNILPLVTGAGLLGLAISFGAQTLVKDIIAGLFIFLENQYNIGDSIKIDKHEGKVIQVTLRLTVLEDKEGNKIFIPNSEIKAVTRLPH